MVPRSGQVPTTTSQPAAVEPADGVGEVPHRHRRLGPAGDVVGADHDQGDVGLLGQGLVDLRRRARGSVAPETASRTRRTGRSASSVSAGGDQHAGRLGGPLDAEADGAGVAEDGEHERLAAAAAVDAVARRRVVLGRPGLDLAAGGAGLLAEQGEQGGPAQADAAAAVGGAGRQSSCRRRPRHVPPSRSAVVPVCSCQVIGPLRCSRGPSPAGVTQSTEFDERAAD